MKQKVVLITGGIGSGKTTIARYINEYYGIPVFYSDDEAKKLYFDPKILAEISKLLGENIISKDGSLDKKALANIIFNDEEKKLKLESYIHPKVRERFRVWASQQIVPIVVMESAVALKNGRDDFDYVIMVDASEETRLARAMKRDSTTKEKILARMRSQRFDPTLIDFIISNEQDFKDAIISIISLILNVEAIMPGSFDPFTIGHLSILKKASTIFKKVYVVLAHNEGKRKRTFSNEKMKQAIENVIISENLSNCEVVICKDYVPRLCRDLNVSVLVRGARDEKDLTYEEKLAALYRKYKEDVTILLIPADVDKRGISSTLVRDRLSRKESVENLVPAPILQILWK